RRFIAPGARSPRAAYAHLTTWILRNRNWLLEQDIVHCHLSMGSVFGGLLQIVRGRRSRPAVVETYHAVGMAIPDRDRAIHAALLKHRDAVAFMADDPFWQGFRERHSNGLLRVIPNGIDPGPNASSSSSKAYRKQLGLPLNAVVVGSIGRMV